jgi:hypothetical protein
VSEVNKLQAKQTVGTTSWVLLIRLFLFNKPLHILLMRTYYLVCDNEPAQSRMFKETLVAGLDMKFQLPSAPPVTVNLLPEARLCNARYKSGWRLLEKGLEWDQWHARQTRSWRSFQLNSVPSRRVNWAMSQAELVASRPSQIQRLDWRNVVLCYMACKNRYTN